MKYDAIPSRAVGKTRNSDSRLPDVGAPVGKTSRHRRRLKRSRKTSFDHLLRERRSKMCMAETARNDEKESPTPDDDHLAKSPASRPPPSVTRSESDDEWYPSPAATVPDGGDQNAANPAVHPGDCVIDLELACAGKGRTAVGKPSRVQSLEIATVVPPARSKIKDLEIVSCKPYVVSDALSIQSIRSLLHGIAGDGTDRPVTTTGRRKRQTTQWPGILKIDGTTGCFAGISDVVSRGRGRFDYTFNDSLIESILSVRDRAWIDNTVTSLATRSGQNPETWNKTAHVMICRPGASDQAYHCDDEEAAFYYTLSFPLTIDSFSAGYTQFENDQIVPPLPTQCLLFDGKTSHRGLGNASQNCRVFFYFSLYHEIDGNLAVGGSLELKEEEKKEHRSYPCDQGVVKVGEAWKFIPEPPLKPYIGIIESIVGNTRKKHTTVLEVRWMYSYQDVKAFNIHLKKKELLYTNHFDDTQLDSLYKKVNLAEYCCVGVFDHINHEMDDSIQAKRNLKAFRRQLKLP